MNAEQLEKSLEVLAEAEGGIPKLRELILQLAVMGRLVEQVTAASWKNSALNRGVRPFEVPTKWDWVTFGDLVEDISSGWSPQCENRPKAGDEWGVLKVSAVSWGRFLPDENKALLSGAQPKEHMEVRPGDLLMSRANTAELVGRSVLVETTPPRLILSDKILRISVKSNVEKEYLNMVNATRLAREYLGSRASGTSTSMRNISREVIKAMPVPLPPQSEQKQIVTRVRELMALCDELERRQQRRHSLRRAAHTAALDALTQAATPDELERAWGRLKQHWDVFATRADAVPPLRQAILQLAVQGKLVSQEAGDEPATKLLSNIIRRRQELITAEIIRPRPSVPEIDSNEQPWILPASWAWSRLGDLCLVVADGPHFSPKYVSREEGVPFLSTRNVTSRGFLLDDLKYVSHSDHKEFCRRVRPAMGDILYTKGGTTGIAVVHRLNLEFSVWVHLAILRTDSELMLPEYMALALNSPHCYQQSQRYTHGTGNRDLGLTRMVLITVPIPPLAEQKRIVAKVEELMSLCDELERRAQAREEILSRAAQAAVGAMTGMQ